MVHLHCAERGAAPSRPTDDLDTVLDLRSDGHILRTFTSALVEIGFSSAGSSPQGHQHRWTRDRASIDVLIPRHVGRASERTGVTGGTTLEAPGAQQAIDRTADVVVDVTGAEGLVRRPNLLGALVAKAAAHTIPLDTAKRRHRADFAILTTLIGPSDRVESAGKRDRAYLNTMIAALKEDQRTLFAVDGAIDGLEVLREILNLGSPTRG